MRAAGWLFPLSQRGEGTDRADCGLAFHPLPNGAREPIARAADWLFTLSLLGRGQG